MRMIYPEFSDHYDLAPALRLHCLFLAPGPPKMMQLIGSLQKGETRGNLSRRWYRGRNQSIIEHKAEITWFAALPFCHSTFLNVKRPSLTDGLFRG
jgi:hypothetical protein